jgi:hypothetical protein
MFVRHLRQRAQPRAEAAGEHDALHRNASIEESRSRNGRHHDSLARYHAIVSAMPSSKAICGRQPKARSFAASTA